MIVGTAGHIDHGKTALVRALTGVDTDRLPEERRRGITIELGFAPLILDGIGTVGVVDVPGHEAFVRTMVAGASGVDVALLVIAADEGVMPQTREHVAILDLLGVRTGVVALTKLDLVEAEWLELVADDVGALLGETVLAGAPIVPVSSVTGEGLESLRERLREALLKVESRSSDDVFRLPVDRAFSVRGTGTVVTGTIASGSIQADSTVRVFPGPHVARVRGVQAHGSGVRALGPGSRAAIALAGIDLPEVGRGAVLVDSGEWVASRVLRADVSLLDSAKALRPRTRVRLHIGTSETGARVVAAGGPVEPGSVRAVRLVLDQPVVTRAGDRFVLRNASPADTIGGGEVTDPAPPHRRARPWPRAGADVAERLEWILHESAGHGVAVPALVIRLGLRPSAIRELLFRHGHNQVIAEVVYSNAALASAAELVLKQVESFHAGHPLEGGAPLQEVRARVPASARLVEEVLRALVEERKLVMDGGLVKRYGWSPVLSEELRKVQESLETALRDGGAEPPSVSDLTALLGAMVLPLLRLLGPERVVQVEADRFYHASAVETLVGRLRTTMEEGREYSPAELRDVLGLSRKYLIPFLEFCDRQRVTERRGNGRVLCR